MDRGGGADAGVAEGFLQIGEIGGWERGLTGAPGVIRYKFSIVAGLPPYCLGWAGGGGGLVCVHGSRGRPREISRQGIYARTLFAGMRGSGYRPVGLRRWGGEAAAWFMHVPLGVRVHRQAVRRGRNASANGRQGNLRP